MEWTTQSEDHQPPAPDYAGGHRPPPLPTQPDPPPLPARDTQPLPPLPPTHLPEESVAPPVTSPPPPVPTYAAPAPAAPGTAQTPAGFDHCPSCGALVANDQRYCLECGHRRGEPRLPFMDAVVFMDAMNRPPEAASASTKSKKRGISPNAALIAGVGTLLLALGIGVLIGKSGNHSAPASQAPIVIKGGAGEEATTASSGEGSIGGTSTKGKSKKQVVKQKKQEAESGQGAAEVLHYQNGVKPPPAKVEIGDKCEKDVAGCSKSGHFDGSFFGEE